MKNIFNISKHLNPSLKFRYFILIIMQIVVGIIELISITSIIPLIDILFGENEILQIFNTKINLNIEPEKFLILISVIFFLRFLIFIFYYYHQSKFSYDIQKYFSLKLFKHYINKNYLFHLGNNSSYFLRNIFKETNELTQIFIFLITLFSEIIISLFIVFFIIFYLGLKFLIILLIFTPFFFVYVKIINLKIQKLGEERIKYDGERIKIIQETFKNIKNIKLFFKEKFLTKTYSKFNTIASDVSGLALFFKLIPKTVIEFFAVIFLFVFIYMNLEKSNAEIFSTLAVLAIGFFKILPSFGKIISTINSIKFGEATLYATNEVLNSIDKSSEEYVENKKSISEKNEFYSLVLKNINFKYEKKNIFENTNFEINKYDKIGLIGESGVGKSTFLDILSGLLEADSGSIIFNEKTVEKIPNNFREKIGYISQNSIILDDTLKNNVIFGDENIDEKKFREVLEISGLLKVFKNIDEKISLGEEGSQISGGQKQRINIARVLYKNPEFILMDEPTSALDKENEDEILESIFNIFKDKTILFVTHKKENLKFVNKIYTILDKKIILDSNS